MQHVDPLKSKQGMFGFLYQILNRLGRRMFTFEEFYDVIRIPLKPDAFNTNIFGQLCSMKGNTCLNEVVRLVPQREGEHRYAITKAISITPPLLASPRLPFTTTSKFSLCHPFGENDH